MCFAQSLLFWVRLAVFSAIVAPQIEAAEDRVLVDQGKELVHPKLVRLLWHIGYPKKNRIDESDRHLLFLVSVKDHSLAIQSP
eukprot:Pgem_evm2s19312